MIRWCSYCQRFMGESEPLQDHSLTHGICATCSGVFKSKKMTSERIAISQKIAGFYSSMRSSALAGIRFSIDDAISEGRKLGINDLDLCLGMLQPILYEIGEMWKNGQVTVAMENQFTLISEQLIEKLRTHVPTESRSQKSPSPFFPDGDSAAKFPVGAGDAFAVKEQKKEESVDFLLVCAYGNYHSVGVKIIDLAMKELGLTTKSFTPGLPNTDILALVNKFNPKLLGISVSLSEQIPNILALHGLLQSHSGAAAPTMLVGGQGIFGCESHFAAFPSILVAAADVFALKTMVQDEFIRIKKSA